jgi:EF-P beta-lysylation protein EpmB
MPEPNINPAAARATDPPVQAAWRHELRSAIRSASELCEVLGLADTEIATSAYDTASFPMLVPRCFVKRMRHGDPADPLLRQVLALRSEQAVSPGYTTEPLLESSFAQAGVVRKYAGRALLITTAACPVHCRYCFRRHFPYADQLAARNRWVHALEVLRGAPDVEEVILSGGDPLSLSTQRLSELIGSLEAIPSVKTLRIHTRFPIIVPSRVTRQLTQALRSTRLHCVVVVHCNHANELDSADVLDALQQLRECTGLLLNQAVLLHGINDTLPALSDLSAALFRARVMPYYLHMLDKVAGSAHFEVSQDSALKLMSELRQILPGYLVPRLVREDSGALSKTPLI